MNTHPIKAAREASRAARPTDEEGMCLRQVRGCYDVPAKSSDAAEAYVAAEHKHPQTDPHNIPRGAPVFWLGGSHGHGHIAIATGNGRCWSTDIRRPGYFDHVDIDEITRTWGLTLVGWTEDLNGVRVYTPGDQHK